ncbi:dihydrolipoyl dehydrogenase family protein [Clostridiisalibacter paucivorans]|uniref:dihydrolipoyl dehydrogenase family protein n=1 Tax=Clostridiisalibacter paucivorans TaxID=408753 RepID=UPI00047C1DFA|nr:NAD(P)/FAD-dependent oxidoreductase [Clostridiisalibacter paucivorans]
MKEYQLIVIGLGPAGMAVTSMAVSMGLDVLAIEDHKIGGECLNYGCIPSKSLLKAAEAKHNSETLEKFGLKSFSPEIEDPLQIVRNKIQSINGNKTNNVFEKADLILNKGKAKFIDEHTVEVGNEQYKGKNIFISTGTKPFVPPIPGLKEVPILTNSNLFEQKSIPETLTIIGGGAIGSEMAQAFARLGSKVTLVQMDPHLIPVGDEDAGRLLEEVFKEENIEVYNSTNIEKVEEKNNKIYTYTDKGTFESDKILVATGRTPVLEPLALENGGIEYDKKGINVDSYYRTNKNHIYAIGDCNGKSLLSHAAMHQGMLALMNALSPEPIESFKNENWLVPWSVFTEPEVAQVGLTEKQAKEKNIEYMPIQMEYKNYGRAIADSKTEGFIKVLADNTGKIYGATIIGESASELIHEWTLAMQNGLSMFNIAMTQHSFPTISTLNSMIAQQWMTKMVQSGAMEQMMSMM